MVRSNKNSSSKKSLKNMHPSQFNNPRRNVNNLGGNTADKNMQNHDMMPNASTHNTVNMNKQDHVMMPNLVAQSFANSNRPNLSMMLNDMTQNTANLDKQDHNIMENPVAQSLVNFNSQTNDKIPNTATKLPQWYSQISMRDILNNYINSPNSSNSLFTSGHDLFPQSNFHPTLDCNQINSNNGKPSLLDQFNFPRIKEQDSPAHGSRKNTGSQYSNTLPGARPYVKVMKTSTSDTSEFKMHNKDFPALPGTQVQMHDVPNASSTMIDSNQQWYNANVGSKLLNKPNMNHFIGHNSSRIHLDTDFHMNGRTVPKPGIQTSLDDGKVTNIPSSMLRDQFGIIGQLVNMRTAEHDPELVVLTFGQDLTSLGMNMNSSENIYPTFAGPFENAPLGPHNIEFDVPPEYRIHDKIKNKLAPIQLSEYNEDLLFYLFYTHFGDWMQMAVVKELQTRGWRYHTGLHMWITHVSNSSMSEINGEFEHGTFYVFDVRLWRKVPRELIFDPTMLDEYIVNASFTQPGTSSN